MPTRDEYVETIKHTFVNMGDELVMAYLIARMPFFSLPVVKKITSFVIRKVLGIIAWKTELGAFFLFIDFRTSSQGRAFYDKAVKNRDVQNNPNATPQEKENAKLEAIDTFRVLVKYAS